MATIGEIIVDMSRRLANRPTGIPCSFKLIIDNKIYALTMQSEPEQ